MSFPEFKMAGEIPHRLTEVSAWKALIPIAFALTEWTKPATIVELGTHAGDSYCAFCQAVEHLGLDTKCYAIDTWQGDEHAGNYESDVLINLRAYHDKRYSQFSELVQSTFDDALHRFRDGSIDILHIDGLHTYEAVKHDFDTWLPKISSRGIVLFHDTQVRERDFGVWKIWEELSKKYPSGEFKFGYGLGVIAVGTEVPAAIKWIFETPVFAQTFSSEMFRVLGERCVLLGEIVEKDKLISHRDDRITSLEGDLAHYRAIRGSKLWKLSASAQMAMRPFRLAKIQVVEQGGILQLGRNLLRVVKQEGMAGLRSRLRR